MSCQLIHYVPEDHDAFFKVMEGFDAVIVRCNPGQVKADPQEACLSSTFALVGSVALKMRKK